MSDNVVKFEPRSVALSLERYTRREPGDCEHWRYAINTDDRRVYCEDCGETVDPYEALLRYATRDEREGRRDASARKLEDLLAFFAKRSFRIARRDDGFTVSAVGKTGQRVNSQASGVFASESYVGRLVSALADLKDRMERWTERDLEYPRFTVTRRRRKDHPEGHIEVGILTAPARWERIGCASDDRGVHKLVRVAAQSRAIERTILDDRPRRLWGVK